MVGEDSKRGGWVRGEGISEVVMTLVKGMTHAGFNRVTLYLFKGSHDERLLTCSTEYIYK